MLIHYFIWVVILLYMLRIILTIPAAKVSVFYQDDSQRKIKRNFICLHTRPGCFVTVDWAKDIVSRDDGRAKNPNIIGFTITYHREWMWVKEGTHRPAQGY